MSRSNPVTRDPQHPDFPHRTSRGYHRGCHEDCCRRAVRLARKTTQLREYRHGSDFMDAERIIAHVNSLREAHPEVSVASIARAAGVNPTSLWTVLTDGRGRMRRTPGLAILGVTVESAMSKDGYDDPQPYIDMVRRLQAHGYKFADIGAVPGHTNTTWAASLCRLGEGRQRITGALARHVVHVYSVLSERPAGPSERAALAARKMGYFPPACYDENGEYIPGSSVWEVPVPSTAVSTQDQVSARLLGAVKGVLVEGLSLTESTARHRVRRYRVSSWCSDIGLVARALSKPRPDADEDVDGVVLEGLRRLDGGADASQVQEWIEVEVAGLRARATEAA